MKKHKTSKIGVLIFPAGEINSVELHDALSTCVNIRLYGASSIERHGEYVFRNYIPGVPFISDDNFFAEFNRLISENGIDVVFPTHDTVAEYFSARQDKINAKIIASDSQTAAVCRDKKLTFEIFSGEDFCPIIYEKLCEFPVFIKPRKGQGAVGAKLLEQYEEFDSDKYVICEYLPGEEYTVDCLTDKNGELKAILPRLRKRVFGGVSVAGQSESLTDEITHIAQTINSKLKFLGLWYFQIKKTVGGTFKLLEISTRCAGTMCLSRARGVNLPLLSVYAAKGMEIEVFENPYSVIMDRTLISRYKIDYKYTRVYIDFDDTIIVNDKVHLPAVWFLYQCKNNGIETILLTRHDHDHDDAAREALAKYKIDPSLFNEIIIIPKNESKSEKINPKNAIFIDNAYAERKAVHQKHRIPVFDVEGLEILMDWRENSE
jgi:hypothetical protein